jgi:hypothetical protein
MVYVSANKSLQQLDLVKRGFGIPRGGLDNFERNMTVLSEKVLVWCELGLDRTNGMPLKWSLRSTIRSAAALPPPNRVYSKATPDAPAEMHLL